MKATVTQTAEAGRPRERTGVLLEALLVSALGLLLALVANQLSPRGLALTRNYFPGAGKASANVVAGTNAHTTLSGTNGAGQASLSATAARLKEKGLQMINGQEAAELFRDPRYAPELIVFVDARDDQHYQAGHIPGAYQFDHYYPQNYLPTALPACLNAQQIVVYCTGGNCDDSEFTALALHEAGLPLQRLYVYIGGITEWTTHGLAVEIGARKSGNLKTAKP